MRLSSFAVACLASGALAQPAPDSPADACCCCDPSRNVIACTRSIPKADCFCAAVVCPVGAKTVWDNKLQSSTACTGTQTSVSVQASGRHGSVLTVKLPIQSETMIVVDPHPTQATASSNKRDFRNNVENNDKPVVVQNEPFRSRPTTPASSMLPQRVEARSMEAVRLPIQRKTKRMFMVDAHPTRMAKSSDKGSTSDKVENGDEPIVVQHEPFHSRPTTPASSMLHERIAVEKSPSTTHAHGRHSCCCCDIVTEQVVCHVSDEECMCADVMCPENAKTVFATAPAPAPTHTSI